MSEPTVAQKGPFGLDLDEGTYWWCSCGKSANQPFCDASHKGSEFLPKKFVVTEKKEYWVCGCKHSKNPPFCDGTHKGL